MLACQCVQRKRWDLDFEARPEVVGALRRIMRTHLRSWGLSHLAEGAQLILSELVTNVIEHVGTSVPSRLTVMMRDGFLRIEVHDPDGGGATPTSRHAAEHAEGGRGLEIVGALADRWGADQGGPGKVIWAELDGGVAGPAGHAGGHRVDRAEALLLLYGPAPALVGAELRVGPVLMRETAVALLVDLMNWLSSHGWDPGEALDQAHTRFESEGDAA
ncbi:ATP-binding protein [Peterkaempfera bronchialis]|uniref:ATP-binding protein n=1 Tax=Peterkaempfera bronchialis TaxID=2126346 RepID=A0A345SX91_9ACTN|nr:ATP-binding protein [Peterkaempfera bronchialis]AXI78346.1 ATP-binding protein [Peterkaempfera bronchialis]